MRVQLHHRWASSKYYRSFFQDYRAFLSRPDKVIGEYREKDRKRLFIIQTDLKIFYDRVRPNLLHRRLKEFKQNENESKFFLFANKVLQFKWHEDDLEEAKRYADASQIEKFESIALPQGLTASGFFANVVLLPIDKIIIEHFEKEILPDMTHRQKVDAKIQDFLGGMGLTQDWM